MIYFFGTGTDVKMVFGGNSLSEEEKANATVVLEQLPPTNTPEGMVARFYIDPETEEFSYKYENKE